MLWRNSLVMMDEETGSLWSHVVGEALQGPLKGKVLKTVPVVQTSWAAWIKQHPDTKVLKGFYVNNRMNLNRCWNPALLKKIEFKYLISTSNGIRIKACALLKTFLLP